MCQERDHRTLTRMEQSLGRLRVFTIGSGCEFDEAYLEDSLRAQSKTEPCQTWLGLAGSGCKGESLSSSVSGSDLWARVVRVVTKPSGSDLARSSGFRLQARKLVEFSKRVRLVGSNRQVRDQAKRVRLGSVERVQAASERACRVQQAGQTCGLESSES